MEDSKEDMAKEIAKVVPMISKDAKIGKSGKSSKRPKASHFPIRRKPKKVETYAIYIYRVLKQIHPECGISKRGMNIMNSFMNDIFDRMATEATRLLRTSKKKTLSSKEMETAVRLMLPGELSK